ncbi:MAG: hypothetical protein AB7O97_19085 [Planctomycetota bacterium]
MAAFAAWVGASIPAAAQAPPGRTPPTEVTVLDARPAEGSPAMVRWQLGRDAAAKGDPAAATAHLLAALEFHPASPSLLLDLALAATAPGERARWTERLARALGDARGRAEPGRSGLDKDAKKRAADLDLTVGAALAAARAQAAAELARALARVKPGGRSALGNGALCRWHAEVFHELATDAPELLRAHGDAFARALAAHRADHDAVCKALLQVAQGRTGATAAPGPADAAAGDDDAAAAERRRRAALALDAARILRGLAQQAGYVDDLHRGPTVDIARYAEAADGAIAAASSDLGAPRVWTIAELQDLDASARDAFTRAHATWAHPAVAVSATGKYRIETVCGHETLLGAAQTIELHHDRIARHMGADPFGGRQGRVRIVPDVADLESDGAPYWWAGGFQGGDETVVRFAFDRISGLGRTLTHELTHRFDGVLRPFLPAWYVEGHADWTAEHYASMQDPDFVDDHLDLGACVTTYVEGYADEDTLRALLRGEPEDYRHNYFAGYTLYAYLRGWPPKQPPRFRERLEQFEKAARGGRRDPVGLFTKTFCDGKDGRPGDLAGFVAGWREFLDGIYRHLDERTRGPDTAWVDAYGRRGGEAEGPVVDDAPTWSWARARAEPFFGQGHAGRAGFVLAAAGMGDAAVAAWLWSLEIEGWDGRVAVALADTLDRLGRDAPAAAVRLLLRPRAPALLAAGGDAATSASLLDAVPKVRAYAEALEAAAAGLPADAGAAALMWRAERARLLELCGPIAADPELRAAPLPPPRAVGALGFVDDDLTDYDDDRVEGLWYANEDGDLHVGRDRDRTATGAADRLSRRNPAFVRTAEWQAPGDYVVRMQVHFTTAFVEGAVVLGHWRRDRGVRIGFRAGDHDYAIGRDEQQAELTNVHVSVSGVFERDRHMPGSPRSVTVDFDRPKPSFELELRVRGPQVRVLVDGQEQLRYARHDGMPIEGHLGFAVATGAYRVQQPTVQRRDQPGGAIGIDIGAAVAPEFDTADALVGLATRGLPLGADGTLVLWLPPVREGVPVDHLVPRALPVMASLLGDPVQHPQLWALAVPADATAADVARIQDLLRTHRSAPLPVVRHRVGAPLTGRPWVLMLDQDGVLRAAAEVGDPHLFTRVQRWAQRLRGR